MLTDNFTSTTIDDITLLHCEGELDLATAPNLRQLVLDNVKPGAKIVIDLEKVTFVDSTGLGVLVGAVKRVSAQQGELILVANSTKVLKILEITGLTQVLHVVDSQEQAFKELA